MHGWFVSVVGFELLMIWIVYFNLTDRLTIEHMHGSGCCVRGYGLLCMAVASSCIPPARGCAGRLSLLDGCMHSTDALSYLPCVHATPEPWRQNKDVKMQQTLTSGNGTVMLMPPG